MLKLGGLPKLASTISTQQLEAYLKKMDIEFGGVSTECGHAIAQEAKATCQKFLQRPADEQGKNRPMYVVNERTLGIRPLFCFWRLCDP